jgi:hypothetical protein
MIRGATSDLALPLGHQSAGFLSDRARGSHGRLGRVLAVICGAGAARGRQGVSDIARRPRLVEGVPTT